MKKDELIKSLEENKAKDIGFKDGNLVITSNYDAIQISVDADGDLYIQNNGKWKKIITEDV